MSMYDLLCTHQVASADINTEHLFLGCPRFASQTFYDRLRRRTTITTFVSAIHHKGCLHLDPIPMLGNAADPHRINLIGSLQPVEKKKDVWGRGILDKRASGRVDIIAMATRPLFRNHCEASHVAVMFACLANKHTSSGSAMDLHNFAYFTIAQLGELQVARVETLPF